MPGRARREGADALDRQQKRLDADAAEFVDQSRDGILPDLAEEAQREVKLGGRRPGEAGRVGLDERRDDVAHACRQREREKQPFRRHRRGIVGSGRREGRALSSS